MHLEAIIFFNVLLYHLISYFLFRLARFCPFFYFFQRDLALSFAELDIYVDMTVRFFVGQKNQCLNIRRLLLSIQIITTMSAVQILFFDISQISSHKILSLRRFSKTFIFAA